ncbi:MAG TPA: hypothetical protein VF524_14205, partial [Polyangia bacterium]
MSRSNRLLVIVGTLCLGGLDGCGDEPAPDRLLFQTEHFSYFATENGPVVCDGTSLWLERVYGA